MKPRTLVIGGVLALMAVGLAIMMGTSTEAQAPKGYSRDLPADARPATRQREQRPAAGPARTPVEEMLGEVTKAVATADAAESEYRKAIDANQKQPGTVAGDEIRRLHWVYSDSLLLATSAQVKSLRAEIKEVRDEVQDLKKVKVLPATGVSLPARQP